MKNELGIAQKVYEDRGRIFNTEPKDNRSTLKVCRAGMRRFRKIEINPPKDQLDRMNRTSESPKTLVKK